MAVPRLSLSSTGKVVYTLKAPYRDGTTDQSATWDIASFRWLNCRHRCVPTMYRGKSVPQAGELLLSNLAVSVGRTLINGRGNIKKTRWARENLFARFPDK